MSSSSSYLTESRLQALHTASKGEIQNGALQQQRHRYPQAKSDAEEPKIPSPKLFSGLGKPADALSAVDAGVTDARRLPSVAECAVHLELLETFLALRVKIVSSDDLDNTFGVKAANKIIYRKQYDSRQRKYVRKPYKLKDKTWEDRRRQKWPYFLGIAAGRFQSWMVKMDAAMAAGRAGKQKSLLALPPLDVLMVWHAFLLNPKDYATFCEKTRLKHISKIPFPWSEIHATINTRDWAFELPEADRAWVKSTAKMTPDLFSYLASISDCETPTPVSAALVRYGTTAQHPGSTPVLSLGELLDATDLTHEEAAFLEVVHAASGPRQESLTRHLVDNVQRQASFVDKMHDHLWIRSPAVAGTLRRARGRYERFLRLFALYPGKMLVPTLDIDLVWHTHQCSAEGYRVAMVERTGKLINHDDKIGGAALGGGMQETKQLFQVRFGEHYSTCLCWDCEALASAAEEINYEQPGLNSPDTTVWAKRIQKDLEYHRCVELARRDGKGRLPVRNERVVLGGQLHD